MEMLVHGLENANIPIVWRDWDMDQGDRNDHKRRQTRVILEMLMMMVVRAAFHSLMILPIIFTGKYHWRIFLIISTFVYQQRMFGKDMSFSRTKLVFCLMKNSPLRM